MSTRFVEVARLPAASCVTAYIVLVVPRSGREVVSHITEYSLPAEAVVSMPRGTSAKLPSSLYLNSTATTPILSVDVAATITQGPETDVASGDVRATVGDVVSIVVFCTVTFRVLVALFPAPSIATTLSVFAPLVSLSVFQPYEYGDDVSFPFETLPTMNSTLATSILSVATASSSTHGPETTVPSSGAVSVTKGGVVSSRRKTDMDGGVFPPPPPPPPPPPGGETAGPGGTGTPPPPPPMRTESAALVLGPTTPYPVVAGVPPETIPCLV